MCLLSCNIDTFFLINWLDEVEDDLYDVVPSKNIVPPEDMEILDVAPGTICRAAYSGQFYKAKIVDRGK